MMSNLHGKFSVAQIYIWYTLFNKMLSDQGHTYEMSRMNEQTENLVFGTFIKIEISSGQLPYYCQQTIFFLIIFPWI